jgi:hypothetical protein
MVSHLHEERLVVRDGAEGGLGAAFDADRAVLQDIEMQEPVEAIRHGLTESCSNCRLATACPVGMNNVALTV